MPTISTSVQINAPPEVVRAKFLDFSSLKTYSPDGMFLSIAPKDPTTTEIKEGTVMAVAMRDTSMEPVVLENSPHAFRWRGALPLSLFTGDHSFRFQPGPTPNTTTFTNEEDFSGYLSFMIGTGAVAGWLGFRTKTAKGFKGFAEDVKRGVEGEGK